MRIKGALAGVGILTGLISGGIGILSLGEERYVGTREFEGKLYEVQYVEGNVSEGSFFGNPPLSSDIAENYMILKTKNATYTLVDHTEETDIDLVSSGKPKIPDSRLEAMVIDRKEGKRVFLRSQSEEGNMIKDETARQAFSWGDRIYTYFLRGIQEDLRAEVFKGEEQYRNP